jgi:hypothetical protein
MDADPPRNAASAADCATIDLDLLNIQVFVPTILCQLNLIETGAF